MTQNSKVSRREYLKAAGAGVVGLAVGAVAGYYGGLSSVPEGGPTPSTVTVRETVTQTQAVTSPTAMKGEFKIAQINAGPSGTQWGQAVLSGEPAAEEIIAAEFPDIQLKWYNSWDVKTTDKPTVYESYIADGVKLFWDTDFTQPVVKPIAEANPDRYFLEAAYSLANTPNVGLFEWDVHIGALLQGVVAGGLTKKNKVGLVAPFKDPYDARTFNCYRQGAKEINPNCECYYVFTGDYHDVSLGMKAATALIAAGCDFIVGEGNGMTNGAIKGAEAAKVYCMGIYSDQYDLAPSVVVTSTLWRSGLLLADAMRMIFRGLWPRTYSRFLPHPHFGYDLKDDSVTLAPFNPAIPVPDTVPQTIQRLKDENKEGKFILTTDEEFPPQLEIA